MILNEFTLGYGLMSGLSLAGGLGAAGVGFYLSLKDPDVSRASRATFLVSTLVFVMLWTRLAMVPLWFWTLPSLVPSIPGAMCLWGVHNANSPVSWIATGLKPVFPFLYGFWVALHSLDVRHDDQPLLRLKLAMLVPLGALLAFESLADLGFLWPLEPVRVTCCTSAYNRAVESGIGAVYTTSYPWAFFVYLLLAAGIMALTVRSVVKKAFSFPWSLVVGMILSCLLCIFALVFSLQAELSMRLVVPKHACIFCLWKQYPDTAFTSLLVFLGIFFIALFVFLGGLAGRGNVDKALAGDRAKAYSRIGVGLLVLGTLGILARFLLSS